MTELTDLEICKRIAEIKGVYFDINAGMERHQSNHDSFSRDMKTGVTNPYAIKSFDEIYNPLTDDALCFQLMVKYKIKVMYESNPNYYHASKVIHTKGKKPFRVGQSDNNPNKAILLAIIEANKV